MRTSESMEIISSVKCFDKDGREYEEHKLWRENLINKYKEINNV